MIEAATLDFINTTDGTSAMKTPVDANTLVAIREMYRNVQTRVRHKGMLSDPFPVLQRTRQGGKSSPLLYLTYINGLIDELQNSGYGCCMYDIEICAPTVADDMVLMSYSKNGPQKMTFVIPILNVEDFCTTQVNVQHSHLMKTKHLTIKDSFT